MRHHDITFCCVPPYLRNAVADVTGSARSGSLSAATAIGAFRFIRSCSRPRRFLNRTGRGVRWTPDGAVQDLTVLLDGQGITPFLTITNAYAINNAGVITVTADDRRTARQERLGFVLTRVQ
jgi:hypothetical protein